MDSRQATRLRRAADARSGHDGATFTTPADL